MRAALKDISMLVIIDEVVLINKEVSPVPHLLLSAD